jgi:hypothetical protein
MFVILFHQNVCVFPLKQEAPPLYLGQGFSLTDKKEDFN